MFRTLVTYDVQNFSDFISQCRTLMTYNVQNSYSRLIDFVINFTMQILYFRNNLVQNWSEYCATANAISFITESMQPLIFGMNRKLLEDLSTLKRDAASTLKSKSVLSFLSETTACTIDNRWYIINI